MIELNSPAEFMDTFTSNFHCLLTMKQLVKAAEEISQDDRTLAVIIITPKYLTLDIFNALLISGGEKYDRVYFDYGAETDKDYKIVVETHSIYDNDYYKISEKCNCLLSVEPYNYADGDYNCMESYFIILHSACSPEIVSKIINIYGSNCIIKFDLVEE
ncbi:MAG: hypothetical protein J6A30_02730 [Ruminococcus sp.]|nr:hypothetical protein [Ruminococcus sp.]